MFFEYYPEHPKYYQEISPWLASIKWMTHYETTLKNFPALLLKPGPGQGGRL
jgi:hypothetical protein